MQISDWFTIVSILLAVFALYNEHERKLLWLKCNLPIAVASAIIFLVIVPLIIFHSITVLDFQDSNLPKATTYAFVMTFSLLTYWSYWFFRASRFVKPDSRIVNFYVDKSPLISTDLLFSLFVKYELPLFEKKRHQLEYAQILTNSEFAKFCLINKPTFYLGFISRLEISVYLYRDLPFFLRNEYVRLAEEEANKGKDSLYNQWHNWLFENEAEEYQLFRLIRTYFDFLEKGIETGQLSDDNTNLINYFPQTFAHYAINIIPVEIGLPGGDRQTLAVRLLNRLRDRLVTTIELSENSSQGYACEMFAANYVSVVYKILLDSNNRFSLQFCKEWFRWVADFFLDNKSDDDNSMPTQRARLFVSEVNKWARQIATDFLRECWDYADDEMWARQTDANWQGINRQHFIDNIFPE